MKNNNWIYKYASVSVIIGPLIEPYNFPATSLSVYKVFMLINVFIFFCHRKDALFVPKYYKFFFLYALIIPILNAVFHGYLSHILGSYLTLILFSSSLILSAIFIDLKVFYRTYRIFGIVTCLVFFAQELSFLIFGFRFMALIPFLDVHYEGFTTESFSEQMAMIDRSCSCFLEPSHFAQFILPLLAIELGLLHDKNKSFGFYPILLTIVLLLLRSGVGLLSCAMLWSFFIIFSKRAFYVKAFVIVPVAVVLSYVFFVNYTGTEQGSALVERVSQLNPNDFDYVSSGIMRVYRGYWVYGDLDFLSKLLGVGIGGADDAIDRSSVAWMFGDGEHYINNIQTLLIGYGVVGFILFLLFLFNLTRKTPFTSTLLVAVFLMTSLMESYFYTTRMLLFLCVPFVLSLRVHRHHSSTKVIKS